MTEVSFDESGVTIPVDFQYPDEPDPKTLEEKIRELVRERLVSVVGKMLSYAYAPSRAGGWPEQRLVQRRLIVLGIVLGVESLNDATLIEFSRRHKICKSRATKMVNKIRRELGVDAFFLSSKRHRASCRTSAFKRKK